MYYCGNDEPDALPGSRATLSRGEQEQINLVTNEDLFIIGSRKSFTTRFSLDYKNLEEC
jgi:hypothetical protein